MGAHVIKSAAAPAAAPTEEQLGSHWIKTSDPVGHWLGVGTTDVDGWLDLVNLPSGGGSGESNTTSNEGTGEGLAMAKSGVNLPFKTLKAGANITLNASADEVEIVAAGGGGGGSSFVAQGVGIAVQVPDNTFDNTIVPLAGYDNSLSNPTTNTFPEYWPIVIGANMTVSSIGAQFPVSSGTPVTVQFALYESDPATGLPTNKLAEKSRTVTSSTNASVTFDTPVAVTAGLHWIATWASVSQALKGVENIHALAFGLFNELTANDEMPTLAPFPDPFNMANASTWGNGQVPVFSVY